MIEFHAGIGPDTQAIGIALEEMFLDYRLMPGRAPMPVIALGGARVVGAPNILMALARKTGRFLPDSETAAPFLANAPLDATHLATRLARADFILGHITIVDMNIYPRLAGDRVAFAARPAIGRWASRMASRAATGRGMGVVAK